MTDKKKYELVLKNVRGSFLNVFNKNPKAEDQSKAKYDGKFMISKSDTKTKEQIDNVIKDFLKEHNEGKILSPDKMFITDGDFSDREEYKDHWIVSAGNKFRPTVIDRQKHPVTEEDGVIYSGAYYNIKIDLWWQNSPKYGKRVNSNLQVVQFFKDGEEFAGRKEADTSDFEVYDDDTDV